MDRTFRETFARSPVPPPKYMTSTGDAALRQLALNVLSARAGSGAGAAALAAAAASAYSDLVRVVSPLIGHLGVEALTGRAVHLAQQNHTWLVSARGTNQVNQAMGQVIASLEQQEPAVAAEAAANVFALLAELLVTFIGASLTTGLLRQAWPDAFVDVGTEERKA
jgi:hypothetical protein